MNETQLNKELFNMNTINLSLLSSIAESINIASKSEFIFGRGWHEESLLEKKAYTKQDLNKISTEKPIIFLRVCGHVLVCNDKAMELAEKIDGK